MCLIVWNNTITWLSDFQALASCSAAHLAVVWDRYNKTLWPFICCREWHSKQTLWCWDTRLFAETPDQIHLNVVVERR